MCPIFVNSVHNFCRSDNDMIQVKKCLFPIDAYVVWCPTWLKNLGRYLRGILFIIKVQSWLPDCPLIFFMLKWFLVRTLYGKLRGRAGTYSFSFQERNVAHHCCTAKHFIASTFRKYLKILFCFENYSDSLWEKIVLALFQDSTTFFSLKLFPVISAGPQKYTHKIGHYFTF